MGFPPAFSDGSIKVPGWIMPAVLTLFMLLGGISLKSIAADEAKLLDDAHNEIASRRLDDLDKKTADHDKKISVIENEFKHLKEAVVKTGGTAEENKRLLIRIAAKLDVPD